MRIPWPAMTAITVPFAAFFSGQVYGRHMHSDGDTLILCASLLAPLLLWINLIQSLARRDWRARRLRLICMSAALVYVVVMAAFQLDLSLFPSSWQISMFHWRWRSNFEIPLLACVVVPLVALLGDRQWIGGFGLAVFFLGEVAFYTWCKGLGL